MSDSNDADVTTTADMTEEDSGQTWMPSLDSVKRYVSPVILVLAFLMAALSVFVLAYNPTLFHPTVDGTQFSTGSKLARDDAVSFLGTGMVLNRTDLRTGSTTLYNAPQITMHYGGVDSTKMQGKKSWTIDTWDDNFRIFNLDETETNRATVWINPNDGSLNSTGAVRPTSVLVNTNPDKADPYIAVQGGTLRTGWGGNFFDYAGYIGQGSGFVTDSDGKVIGSQGLNDQTEHDPTVTVIAAMGNSLYPALGDRYGTILFQTANNTPSVTANVPGRVHVNNAMFIDAAGRVGINTLTPTAQFHVVGDARVTTNMTADKFYSSGNNLGILPPSDRRLKENITETKWGLDTLKQISVVDYNFIGKTKPQQGVIAQDLYDAFPWAVEVGTDDLDNKPWRVDYTALIPLLIQSVKDLEARLAALSPSS